MNCRPVFAAAIAVAAFAVAAPARANSYSDITGTNIWNDVVPILREGEIDADLIARAEALNEDAAIAYRECDAAIAAAAPDPNAPRFYTREPQSLPTPPTPQACLRLEELRREADDLRAELAEVERQLQAAELRAW